MKPIGWALAVVFTMGTVVPAAMAGAKPVRPASQSTVNAPPPAARGVPGPAAGAGLPVLLVVGGLAWMRRARLRRGRRTDVPESSCGMAAGQRSQAHPLTIS